MPSTITPNMSLVLPTPGLEPGPTYATDQNSSFSLIDTHDHSSGKGVPITPAGITISSDLDFLSNDAIGLRSSRYVPGSTISGGSDTNCIYVSGVDLYYTDGSNNIVRITQGGGVAGATGSIANLVSPASAVFNALSATITFESDTSTAANLDAGSIVIREVVANAKGVTLSSPTALSADYTITLPGSLPASQKFVTLDSGGNLAASWVVDNSTIEVSSNTVRVKDNGITTAKILDEAVTGPKIEGNVNLGGANATMGGHWLVTQSAATGLGNLQVVRGTVNSAGTKIKGEGFTSVKNSTGNYTVTFSSNFDDTPSIVVTGVDTTFGIITPIVGASPSTAAFVVKSFTSSSVAFDTGFHFIAMGPGIY